MSERGCKIEHGYSPVSDEHWLYVSDVDGSQVLAVYFDSRDCPATDEVHSHHDDITETLEALQSVYGLTP